jgi:hypothetical protein
MCCPVYERTPEAVRSAIDNTVRQKLYLKLVITLRGAP